MKLATTTCLFLVLAVGVAAEEWPGWRGPRGDGTSLAQRLPVEWSATSNVAWKTPIPGIGHSSPIIWGDRIFLTTCLVKDHKRVLLCLDRKTGKIVWQNVVVVAPLEEKHQFNSYASSTPATDGERVYVSFLANQDVVVACYDFNGRELWRQIPGKFFSKHGFCSSPVLYRDLVILNGDQDAEAWIVALDRRTGAERWRADRPNRTRSYCVPIIVEAAGKKQLVLSGSKCVASYDPDTGKQHWLIDGPTEQFVASLVFAEGMLFLTGGYPDYHLMGIRPDGEGNVTASHVAWRHGKTASYVPSPVASNGMFFVVTDGAVAICLDAKTGEKYWTHRLGRRHSSSALAANGHVYFTDDDGKTWVVKASKQFELVAKNDLQEGCSASPAVHGDQIFIRTDGHLWCIGK